MITREQILDSVIDKWSEYIEMYPGQEGEVVSLILASELRKQMEETEYYKRLSDARIPTKH